MSHKIPISICIVAHNEEKNIQGCIESVIEHAGQVVVLNAGSTDATEEIIKKFPSVTYTAFPNETNININKNRSFDAATEPWSFFLDADERFTPELWYEVEQVIAKEEYNGYQVGRKNFYFGKWLRFGGQYPELQPRMFRTGKARFAEVHEHEYLQIEGNVGRLRQPFLHFTYPNMKLYFHKFERGTTFQAEFLAKQGVRWTAKNHLKYAFIRPWGRFAQKYIVMAGFLDGFRGFFVAAMQGISEFAAYLKLYDYMEDTDSNE